MELKGIIQKGESRTLTCCQSVEDVLVGGVSLFDELEKYFGQDAAEYFEAPYDEPRKSPEFAVRYVVLDELPAHEKTFDEQSAETVMNMLYAEHVSGCYSEWTCGYGSFDYVLGKEGEGHSIFKELESSIGKYLHFKI